MSGTQQQWEDHRFINMYVIADLVNQPIHITTPDGIVRFVNKAWCIMYRKTLEEAVGRHIHDVLEGENLNFYLSVKDESAENLENISYEHFTEPKRTSAAVQAVEKGRQITCLTQTPPPSFPPTYNQKMVTATPIFNDRNEIICVFTLVQDLTAMGRWQDAIEREMQKNTVLQRELQYLRSSQANSNLIGNSKAMVALRRLITVMASSDANVLISGESGVGKEVVAKEIYSESQRKGKPFITVNCAAIPENLLESELFGHEKGAFTGAISSKVGLFEMANCGTIMLDEIGEFPLHLQPKLLRVLQEQEFRRVGGTKRIPIDVRVIAATNRDLLAMTKNGSFRMDLYYRLNVFPIHIPALRQRKEDIPLLASAFLNKFNKKYQKSKIFTTQAIFSLEQYPWMGNVRELENAVERLVVIGEKDAITVDQVCAVMGTDSSDSTNLPGSVSLKESVAILERRLISEALSTYKTTYKAAEALGTTQSTIVRKAKALGITGW